MLVAVVMIGGTEIAAAACSQVPQYILPQAERDRVALVTDFPLILPHLGYTLVELFSGFAIGALVGLVLAAVITQFPFAEKIVDALHPAAGHHADAGAGAAADPALRLRLHAAHHRGGARRRADGDDQRRHRLPPRRPRQDRAGALLRRLDLQIFWKIRAPMALPMILVGLMIGAIFGLLTAVGAEMVGGGFGLGNRLTSYSSMIQMPQFFAVVLILSILGILIYVLFFLIGKKWASWEA